MTRAWTFTRPSYAQIAFVPGNSDKRQGSTERCTGSVMSGPPETCTNGPTKLMLRGPPWHFTWRGREV